MTDPTVTLLIEGNSGPERMEGIKVLFHLIGDELIQVEYMGEYMGRPAKKTPVVKLCLSHKGYFPTRAGCPFCIQEAVKSFRLVDTWRLE